MEENKVHADSGAEGGKGGQEDPFQTLFGTLVSGQWMDHARAQQKRSQESSAVYDQIQTSLANVSYLLASQAPTGHVDLNLKSFNQLLGFEEQVRKRLNLNKLLSQPLGNYFFKLFVTAHGGLQMFTFVDAAKRFSQTYARQRRTMCSTLLQVLHSLELFLILAQMCEQIVRQGKEAGTPTAALETALSNVKKHLERFKGSKFVPDNMFQEVVVQIKAELRKLVPSFVQSPFYKQYICLLNYAKHPIRHEDFKIFRVLGRGSFGEVFAVMKKDTQTTYAMKEMLKRLIQKRNSQELCVLEKNTLAELNSPFVLNLKYSFVTESSIFLVVDMCSGGDLQFHMASSGLSLEQSRFYAAESLLGLEEFHSKKYIYRDMKPENCLLTAEGHLKISDLGLVVKQPRHDRPLRQLAGTAGYWAPEVMAKVGTHPVSDIWSWAVMLYEMLCGDLPKCKCKKNEWCTFSMKRGDERKAAKLGLGRCKVKLTFPQHVVPEAQALLKLLLVPNPKHRLGYHGLYPIKDHPFFSRIDWTKLLHLEVPAPFVPARHEIHAKSIAEVGRYRESQFTFIKLSKADIKEYGNFNYISTDAVQTELVEVLKRNEGFRNAPPRREDLNSEETKNNTTEKEDVPPKSCCTVS